MQKTNDRHVKTIIAASLKRVELDEKCATCQSSCQSACKTSCTVANQVCPR